MSTLPVYSIPKVDGKLDKDAPVIRDQEITQTGFSYPGDVPQGETNYSFYVIKESDRKPILIGTGDVIVSKDGSFFYVAVNMHAYACRAAGCSKRAADNCSAHDRTPMRIHHCSSKT